MRVIVVLILAGFMFAACGYHSPSSAPSVIPDDIKTLAVVGVDNPTLDPNLGQDARSRFHDEILRRGRFTFAERDKADALVRLIIPRQTTASRVEDSSGETVKLEFRVWLRAQVTRRVTGEQITDTGDVTAFQTFFGSSDDEARDQALDLTVRRLVDRLATGF